MGALCEIPRSAPALWFAAVLGIALSAADRVPTPVEQARFLAATRARALNYSQSLPDFICTQQIFRSMRRGTGAWREVDRLTVRLSFSSRGEQYTLLQVNGAAARASYDSVGGSTSQGEFGSLLRGIFEPDAGTQFHFERRVNRGRQPAVIYSYRIPPGSASHSLLAFREGSAGRLREAQAGLRGELIINTETNVVMQITAISTDIPTGFPIRASRMTISYGYAAVGGKRYLLPSLAIAETSTAATSHQNRIEFQKYSKFSTDSSISFEEDQENP
jgi:hypothetical protein